ncbi:MAG: DUF4367 domain-containing protein [Cellulosilyticaceae bacterium]
MKGIDESDITKAAEEAEAIILEQLKKLNSEEHKFSQVFESQMNEIIKTTKRTLVSSMTRKIGIAMLIIGIAGSLTMSVEAVRIRVIEFIAEVFEEFTSISYQKEEERTVKEICDLYLPQNIPEGFIVVEEEEIFNNIHITYRNDLGEEILFRRIEVNANDMIIDTENTALEEILLEDRVIYYYENKEVKNILWIQDEYQLIISSKIDKDRLMKMCRKENEKQ